MSEEDRKVIALTDEWRAADLFKQLENWRVKGYDPQLWSAPDGWVLILDMTKWGQNQISERNHDMLLRFNTAPALTPQGAIEAALKVIQP